MSDVRIGGPESRLGMFQVTDKRQRDDVPKNMTVPLMPPRLKARIEGYKAAMPPFAPISDRILVYPLDAADQPEKSDAGLYLAQQTKDKLGSGRGLLVAAGMKAIEELYSQGIAVGDVVIVARFSPYERQYWSGGKLHKVLLLRSCEVQASDDLRQALDAGEVWMQFKDDGTVELHDRENARERRDPMSPGDAI